MAYYLKGKNLADFGIVVEKPSEIEVPKRKELTERNWAGENGVEAFTTTADIKLDQRTISLNCVMVADTYTIIETNMAALQAWLYQSGELAFTADHITGSTNVYFKDGFTAKPLNNYITGQQAYQFELKLKTV